MRFFHYINNNYNFYSNRINNEITIGEAENILKISRKNNWTNITMRLLKIIGYKLFENKSYALSFDYLLDYINTSNDIYKDSDSPVIFNKMGICQNCLNEIDESIVYLKKAEITAKKFNNLKELKKIYYNLCIVYGKSNLYEISLEYIKKSINISSQIKDIYYYQYAKSCEANCYAKLNQLDKAINIYRDLLRDKPVDKSTAYFYNNLASIYIEKGDFDKAAIYTNQAYSLKKAGKETSVYETMRTEACLYEAKKMYNEAICILKKIIANDVGYDHTIKINSYKTLADIYGKFNRTDLQCKALQQLIIYTNSYGSVIEKLSSYEMIMSIKLNNLLKEIKSYCFKDIELSR